MGPDSIRRPNLRPESNKAQKTGPLSFWNRPKRPNNCGDRAKPRSEKKLNHLAFGIVQKDQITPELERNQDGGKS